MTIRHPAFFLDRDGTLIEDAGYIKQPSDVVFYPFTMESLKKLQEHFMLFIISNQSGIAKGIVTEKEVKEVNQYISDFLRSEGITLSGIFYCPHGSEDKCACKKPGTYFIFEADRLHSIDLSRSFITGDHPSDVQCGLNAGITPVYLLTGHGHKHRGELPAGVRVCDDLLECAKFVISTI